MLDLRLCGGRTATASYNPHMFNDKESGDGHSDEQESHVVQTVERRNGPVEEEVCDRHEHYLADEDDGEHSALLVLQTEIRLTVYIRYLKVDVHIISEPF